MVSIVDELSVMAVITNLVLEGRYNKYYEFNFSSQFFISHVGKDCVPMDQLIEM